MFAIKCWGPSEKLVKMPNTNGATIIEDSDESEARRALKGADMDTSFT